MTYVQRIVELVPDGRRQRAERRQTIRELETRFALFGRNGASQFQSRYAGLRPRR